MVTAHSIKWLQFGPLFLLIVMSGLTPANALVTSGLEKYEWSHRLILIFSEEQQVDAYVSQLDQFAEQIDERHIIWIVISEESLTSNDSGLDSAILNLNVLTDEFLAGRSCPQVLLIGKDGLLKNRSSHLGLEAIFSKIDRMPMRIREMQMMN